MVADNAACRPGGSVGRVIPAHMAASFGMVSRDRARV